MAATKLFPNVAVKHDAGVVDVNIAGIESIEVSNIDGYSAFDAMPAFERGCIKEVLIKTSTGASVALYLMADAAEKLTDILKPDLDLEAEVANLRGKPLPSIGEVVEKLVDHMETGAPLPEAETKGRPVGTADKPGELDLDSDDPAGNPVTSNKRTLH